jgi:membrane fusion protein, multidrug efflux system
MTKDPMTTMTTKRLKMFAVLGILGGAAPFAACGGAPEEAASEAPAEERAIALSEADVATAEMGTVAGGVVITGSLQPASILKVKAQVPGTLSQVSVDRGSRVAAGQSIAVITAEGIRGQAEGARAAVAGAEAAVALATQRLEAARTLRQAGAMSQLDYQAAEAGHAAAIAQLAAAKAGETGAAEMAGRATVRAPSAGVVSERMVEQGEVVSPGDELFTVVRSDVLELSGSVPVDAASQIRPGQAVVFTLSAQPGTELRGQVARIEPVADPATRQVGVYFRLNNPGNIIAGQFATGRVLGSEAAQEFVTIPESAVRGTGVDTFVLAVENGRAVKKSVTLGPVDNSKGVVAVVSGLNAGEQVIRTAAAITEGARVQVGARAPAPAPAAAPGDSSGPGGR